MSIKFSGQFYEKFSNIQFHENPSSGTQLFHEDRRTDGLADMTKLTVTSRNFANAPTSKNNKIFTFNFVIF